MVSSDAAGHFPPRFDLSKGGLEPPVAAEHLRAALEEHGFVVVKYGEITGDERVEMLAAARSLFDLPAETKLQSKADGRYLTYIATSEAVPYFEALAVFDAVAAEKARAFTGRMWPEGNDKFCQALNSTSKKMLDLAWSIIDLVASSYGLDGRRYPFLADADPLSRMTLYRVPTGGEEAAVGLNTHVDGNILTVLFQNEVDGLMVKSRGGEWRQLSPDLGSFVVFVGETLKVWSNGRLFAPPHKVMLPGEKDRHSVGLFVVPKDDQLVEAAPELVDAEHPVMFRPYVHKDFYEFYLAAGAVEGALEKFAGIGACVET